MLSKNKKEELKQKDAEIDALVNELVSELSSVCPREPDKRLWTIAKGKESLELLRKCILGAENEILLFFACRTESERIKKEVLRERYIQIIDALDKSLIKGVDVKVIFNKDVDVSSLEDMPDIKQLLLHLGDKFNVRLAAIPATPFNIFDGDNIVIRTRNPSNPEELFTEINIMDAKLAEEYREKFFTVWDKAEIYSYY